MKTIRFSVVALFAILAFPLFLNAQQRAQSATAAVVPRLVSFSGKAVDAQGKPLSGTTGITLSIYKDQTDGAPLWMETQNVQADGRGNYSIQLGATKSDGLPVELFASGEARWLGVRVNGGEEQPRVMLLSVPYALKAGDAATIGGLPPSAFMLAGSPRSDVVGTSIDAATSNPEAGAPPPASTVTTSGGTVNALPLWTTATNVQSSAITQTGSGATAKIGIGTTAPTTALDVHGGSVIRGTFVLPATGAATASEGKASQPENFVASSFSSATSTPVNQTFQWQATPTNNNTPAPGATLSLLYGLGATAPAQTGLRIGPKGIIGFASGQKFPGTGPGSITGVTAGADLIGGGTTGAVTLNLDTKKVPLLASANTFAGTQTFSGSLIANAGVSAPYVNATNGSPSTTAILGNAFSATGEAWGVVGATGSVGPNAYGVYGTATSSTGTPYGVYGQASSTTGVGVFGQNGSLSGEGTILLGLSPVGTFGDGGDTVGGRGVLGAADEGPAGDFINNSAIGYYTLYAASYNAASPPFFAAGPNGYCLIDSSGNLSCSGSKNAVVPIDGGKRIVAMSAIESPQNWFEDAGEAELAKGAAVVQLDSTYTQTVNTGTKYQVFLTPYGDCKGLYVANRTANSFEVHELGGGTTSLSFGYRIMAIRKNYEAVRFADHTRDLDGQKRMEETMNRRKLNPAATPTSLKKLAMLNPALVEKSAAK
jgi:hypothetical protein